MDLDGAVVIVTGASSGIGAATAGLAAAQGAIVVLAARRADRLAALAAELPRSIAVPTDMRDPEAIRHLVETTADRHGRIDVLVNNAGQGLHVPIEQVKLDDLRADGVPPIAPSRGTGREFRGREDRAPLRRDRGPGDRRSDPIGRPGGHARADHARPPGHPRPRPDRGGA